jgi:quercetin dioxygenase-like cupin family protein
MSVTEQQSFYSCDHVVPIEQEPRHHLVFENEFVRAFAVEIAPHERTLCHHHPNDYLLYVALGAKIISAARDEEPKRLNYRDGECELAPAGLVHVVENLADSPFRNIVVELLPAASSLRRGGDPRPLNGDAKIDRIFDDERAAILSLELEPSAQIEIAGPAVVATAYGHGLSPDAVSGIDVKRNSICDLGWIQDDAPGSLRGRRTDGLLAIVFQLGR